MYSYTLYQVHSLRCTYFLCKRAPQSQLGVVSDYVITAANLRIGDNLPRGSQAWRSLRQFHCCGLSLFSKQHRLSLIEKCRDFSKFIPESNGTFTLMR